MPLRSALARLILGCVGAFLLSYGGLARAASVHLHGLILAVEPAKGDVVVRHEAFGAMPGMTMTFRVRPSEAVQRLQPGQSIDAVVDTTNQPWSLSDVRVLRTQNLTDVTEEDRQPHSAIRNVKPLTVGSLTPDTPFADQNGKPFTFKDLRGENVVLAFIYTRCQDARMCPFISGKFHRLQTLFRGTKTHLVEVSLDPGFDTAAVLRRYGKQFGVDAKRWTLLTGDLDRTLDFAAQFDVSALPDPRYGLVHSERTVLIDGQGIVRKLIDETAWSPDEIVAQIKAINHEASNPFLRFNLWLSEKAAVMCGDRAPGFSGIADLFMVIGLFSGLGWLLYRLARMMRSS
jgi:protein SCO1/2